MKYVLQELKRLLEGKNIYKKAETGMKFDMLKQLVKILTCMIHDLNKLDYKLTESQDETVHLQFNLIPLIDMAISEEKILKCAEGLLKNTRFL